MNSLINKLKLMVFTPKKELYVIDYSQNMLTKEMPIKLKPKHVTKLLLILKTSLLKPKNNLE